jgi:hypothetical protein
MLFWQLITIESLQTQHNPMEKIRLWYHSLYFTISARDTMQCSLSRNTSILKTPHAPVDLSDPSARILEREPSNLNSQDYLGGSAHTTSICQSGHATMYTPPGILSMGFAKKAIDA